MIAELTADWSDDERRLGAALLARLSARSKEKEYVEHRRTRAAGGGVR